MVYLFLLTSTYFYLILLISNLESTYVNLCSIKKLNCT